MSNKNIEQQEKYLTNAVDILVQLSKKQQNEEHNFLKDNTKQYLKELCTIHVSGPRRSGHTESIKNIVDKYNLKSLCIFPNKDMCNFFKKKYISSKNNNIQTLVLNNDSNLLGFNITNFDAIIIDNYQNFTQEKKDIIENFYNLNIDINSNFFFIFLQ